MTKHSAKSLFLLKAFSVSNVDPWQNYNTVCRRFHLQYPVNNEADTLSNLRRDTTNVTIRLKQRRWDQAIAPKTTLTYP